MAIEFVESDAGDYLVYRQNGQLIGYLDTEFDTASPCSLYELEQILEKMKELKGVEK